MTIKKDYINLTHLVNTLQEIKHQIIDNNNIDDAIMLLTTLINKLKKD